MARLKQAALIVFKAVFVAVFFLPFFIFVLALGFYLGKSNKLRETRGEL